MINSNGSVLPVSGSPFNENMGQANTFGILADPQGRFLYVLNGAAAEGGMPLGQSGIAGFSINQQTGVLTAVPGSPLLFSQPNNNSFVVDNTGHFIFEPNGAINGGSSGFSVFSINQTSGSLTQTSANSNAPPVGQFSIASPTAPLIFNSGNGLVAAFTVNSQSGQLSIVPGTPTSAGGSGGPMAISADGKFLYVANQTQGNVEVFSIGSSGTLTPVTGAPFNTDTLAQRLALTPDGRFFYIAAVPQNSSGQTQTLKGYAVNPSSGTFTPIASVALTGVTTVNIDHSGQFAYISSVGNLVTYSINQNTGALTQVAQTSAPSSDNPFDMVVVP
jgi:6-phosphogluconolactonase (cycloisomerase 2 family)